MGKANLRTAFWAHRPKNQKRKTNKYMKKKLILIMGAVACLALGPAAFAQTINGDEPNNSILYLPNVSLTTLNQNTFTGIVGGIFYTPYYYNTSINWLGYADPTGAPLAESHTVTVWNDSTGAAVASAVVPAGTAAPLYNGYRWVQLSSLVTLSYQHYYDIGATVTGGVDSWGDLIGNTATDTGSNGQITWNVENGVLGSANSNGPFVQASGGYEFSRVGETSTSSTVVGGTRPGTTDNIYPAPNMAYNLPIPEPASLALAGAAMLFGLALKRKR
jgi:hypothetical protein